MVIKIITSDYRFRYGYGYGYSYGYSWWDFPFATYREVILLNKIEQILSDVGKGLYAYIIAYTNIILTLNIPNIERIYSTKRIWYG